MSGEGQCTKPTLSMWDKVLMIMMWHTLFRMKLRVIILPRSGVTEGNGFKKQGIMGKNYEGNIEKSSVGF